MPVRKESLLNFWQWFPRRRIGNYERRKLLNHDWEVAVAHLGYADTWERGEERESVLPLRSEGSWLW